MRSLSSLCVVCLLAGSAVADEATVWIGTTTPKGGESRGIYRARFDPESGDLTRPELAAELDSPGFQALHPNGSVLYTVFQTPDRQGAVAAFTIRPDDQKLTLLNQQAIGDGGAAHLTVDPTARCLFTAQYGGGSVAVFPLDVEGRIQPRSDLIEHAGSGPNAARQQGPHPHWVGVDPTNRFLMVPDLGIDRIVIYRMELKTGRLTPHGVGLCPAGVGPRHMKFHPNGKYAYVLNELQMSVTAFRYDADAGSLTSIQTVSTLPQSMWEIPNKSSEIRMHPSGRFLYAATRGHDSIAVFAVDSATGKLTFVEREAIRGSWPRNFNLDPQGNWLLAAGRDSNTIAVFRVDQETGDLRFTNKIVNTPTPICVTFGR